MKTPTNKETVSDLLLKHRASGRLITRLHPYRNTSVPFFLRWYSPKRLLKMPRFGKGTFAEWRKIVEREYGADLYADSKTRFLQVTGINATGKATGRDVTDITPGPVEPAPAVESQVRRQTPLPVQGDARQDGTTFGASFDTLLTGLLNARGAMRDGKKEETLELFRASFDLFGLILVSLGTWVACGAPATRRG